MELGEDGFVGDATWAALVDATFTLGDRMLYLRVPHFHGHDVRVLQQALNVLGFACGESRRHLRRLHRARGPRVPAQRGAAVRRHSRPRDGGCHHGAAPRLGGQGPSRTLRRHVLRPRGPQRCYRSVSLAVGGLDEAGERVAGSACVNLAIATTEESRVIAHRRTGAPVPANTSVVVLRSPAAARLLLYQGVLSSALWANRSLPDC